MPIVTGSDTARTRRDLTVGGKTVSYYSIQAATEAGLGDFSRLPASLKVVLENMLRFEDDGRTVSTDDIRAFAEWAANAGNYPREIAYRPARVLMQDFTGVPAVVDLAAMRDGIVALGGDAQKINPLNPVDLVIDHSVMVDEFGNPRAFQRNVDLEYARNMERYQFLKWGQSAFNNFRVVPPGTGICHQVNLENLAQTVWTLTEGKTTVAYPDTVVGTDSHTTMINGLAVLGWGVGGIEAESVFFGMPVMLRVPDVVGVRLTGRLREGVTATDLALTVTERLRRIDLSDRFVEFFGPGVSTLSAGDRAAVANMAPEFGANTGFFPVDAAVLDYLAATGRENDPLFQVAKELEKVALQDEYFTSRKLFPNVDFYSGITLSAMGFPTTMFTVLFALARTVGWIAQWQEMMADPSQKIGRPRQLYTGPTERDYVSIDQRG